MVQQERIGGERESDRDQTQGVEAALVSSSCVMSSWPSTGTIGPVQIGCDPIVSMNGVNTNSAPAETSVPSR